MITLIQGFLNLSLSLVVRDPRLRFDFYLLGKYLELKVVSPSYVRNLWWKVRNFFWATHDWRKNFQKYILKRKKQLTYSNKLWIFLWPRNLSKIHWISILNVDFHLKPLENSTGNWFIFSILNLYLMMLKWCYFYLSFVIGMWNQSDIFDRIETRLLQTLGCK